MSFDHSNHSRHGRLVLAGALLLLAGAAIVMLLWNAVLPGLLHVGAVTYWQALGLLVLARLLLGRGPRGWGTPAATRCRDWRKSVETAPQAPVVAP